MRSGVMQTALGIALGGAVALALYVIAKQNFPQWGLPDQVAGSCIRHVVR